jgi:hypothetical protein
VAVLGEQQILSKPVDRSRSSTESICDLAWFLGLELESRVARSGQSIKTQLILPLILQQSCPRQANTFIKPLEKHILPCIVILILPEQKIRMLARLPGLIGHDWLGHVFS